MSQERYRAGALRVVTRYFQSNMEIEFRRFKIEDGQLDQFALEWQASVRPLREQYGFEIIGAWLLDETNEFVWVLGCTADDGFAAADERYYSSTDRTEIDPDPARLIERVEKSPARWLST